MFELSTRTRKEVQKKRSVLEINKVDMNLKPEFGRIS